jgi:hypothetical protein
MAHFSKWHCVGKLRQLSSVNQEAPLVDHLFARDLEVAIVMAYTTTLKFPKLFYILYVCENYFENYYFVYYYGIKL